MRVVYFNATKKGKSHVKDGAFTLCGRLIPAQAICEESDEKPTCKLCLELLKDEDLKPQSLDLCSQFETTS